jgi:hypothetical protein
MLTKRLKKPPVEKCGPETFGTGLIAIMKRELFCLQNNIYLLLIVFFALWFILFFTVLSISTKWNMIYRSQLLI